MVLQGSASADTGLPPLRMLWLSEDVAVFIEPRPAELFQQRMPDRLKTHGCGLWLALILMPWAHLRQHPWDLAEATVTLTPFTFCKERGECRGHPGSFLTPE